MINVTKLFLSSAILATSALAAENIVFDTAQDTENKGTINVGAGVTIKVAQGKWIRNTGTINFIKPFQGEGSDGTFKILGTDEAEDAKTSGIKNIGASFARIAGELQYEGEGNPINGTYYNFSGKSGIIQVKDPVTDETKPLTEADYVREKGGAIVNEGDSLYRFLREVDEAGNNDAGNVVVLRGTDDMPGNMVMLDHSDDGEENKTTTENAMEVKTPIVNSIKYRTFQEEGREAVNFDKDYAFGVKGYYKFTGDNSDFSAQKIEFMEGSSEFNTGRSLFGVKDITISGGEVNIKMDDPELDGFFMENTTLNVTSHKNQEEADEYGCFKITSGSCVIDEGSVLNLGVPKAAPEEAPNQGGNNP